VLVHGSAADRATPTWAERLAPGGIAEVSA